MDKSKIEEKARRAILPLTQSDSDKLFWGVRTNAGRSLPPYYLVYFLLVDLLGFKYAGKAEKVAWSVAVNFEGTTCVIEHRKFGLGIFVQNPETDEVIATKIASKIHAGVKAAEPYFDHLAQTSAKGSNLNVNNNSEALFSRFDYFTERYKAKRDEAEERKNETVRTEFENGFGISYPAFQIRREARWEALSAIEAFFSWTEHILIHLAIIQGHLTTGEAVAKMAEAQWTEKFKTALDLSNKDTKILYDHLSVLRRQLRNFVAHGSFGKDGQAFSFHSAVGAVPLILPHRRNKDFFQFGNGVDFVSDEAITLALEFIDHLWSGPLAPAKIYIQESGLPLILTYAADGTYSRAMSSEESMAEFVEYQNRMFDDAANMDF